MLVTVKSLVRYRRPTLLFEVLFLSGFAFSDFKQPLWHISHNFVLMMYICRVPAVSEGIFVHFWSLTFKCSLCLSSADSNWVLDVSHRFARAASLTFESVSLAALHSMQAWCWVQGTVANHSWQKKQKHESHFIQKSVLLWCTFHFKVCIIM